jgi:hypothetical protein
MEVGYRIVPIVLGLKAAGLLKGLGTGSTFPETRWGGAVRHKSERSRFPGGLARHDLGARAFERGPGIYGIIGAYHPYLATTDAFFKKRVKDPGWSGGENIAASPGCEPEEFQGRRGDPMGLPTVFRRPLPERPGACDGSGRGQSKSSRKFGDDGVRYFGAEFDADGPSTAPGRIGAGRLRPA